MLVHGESWPICAAEEGCTGIRIEHGTLCLMHVDEGTRTAFLSRLRPEIQLDLRGTEISSTLLNRIREALRSKDGVSRFGRTSFEYTRFSDASFEGVQFKQHVRFVGAQFSGNTSFSRARFVDEVSFRQVQFGHLTWFEQSQFDAQVWFTKTRFDGDVSFREAQFSRAGRVGPLLASGSVVFRGATFGGPVLIEVLTRRLSLALVMFSGPATLRVRWAEMVLDGAMFTQPSTLSFAEAFKGFVPMEADWGDDILAAPTTEVPEPRRIPRLISLRGVDVRNLVLAELDLGLCLFQGAHHLGELRIEGRRPFADTPHGWRWTRRQALAEEHFWRATHSRPPRSGEQDRNPSGWNTLSPSTLEWVSDRSRQPVEVLEPSRLVLLYRALRKAQEDSKNEPGAADFYYGEMEMRRLDRKGTSWAERAILTIYWLLSGYSLRAWRTLAWLSLVILSMAALFHYIGFARTPPSFWDSLLYAMGATLSISENVPLTEWGRLLRIILRLVGPLLLGLALLSVRNRVKR